MRDLPWLHLAIYLGAVFIATLSQVLLRKAAMRPYRSFVERYLNPQVIFACGLFFLATLIDVITYREIPLSLGPIPEASVYLYVLIFGAMFFGERIMRRKLLALTLIFGGIILFTLSA